MPNLARSGLNVTHVQLSVALHAVMTGASFFIILLRNTWR